MRRKRPEFYAIVLELNGERYYLRKGYWTVFMSDINFAHLFPKRDKVDLMKHHIDRLILGKSGYNILIDWNKNIVKIQDPDSIKVMEVTLSV